MQLNVVITTDYFPPHVGGGVEVVTYHLAMELTRLGHKISVVTLRTDESQPVESLNGIRIHRAKPVELTQRFGIQSAFSFQAIRLIDDVCREEKAQILHANNLYFSSTLAACCVSKWRNLPMITTMHVGDTSHLEGVTGRLAKMYDQSIGRWILGCSWHVVAVSKAVMCYAEELGVPSSRLSMIPNAVDLEEFSAERETSSGNVIRVGFVGRLLSNKGPQYLVKAAGKAARECPKLEFLLVGNGPMRKQLDQQITRLGLNNRFHFLGVVPSVSEFLKRCDIFVRPSLTEGMPLTVLEAMACGVPTIASRVGGTPELIVDGENGFLIEPRNTDELCDRLLRLGIDEELRRVMGLRSRAYVEEHNSWTIVATEISRIYQEASKHYPR